MKILLILVFISVSLNGLIPGLDNAIELKEYEIRGYKGITTYKIINNQTKPYFQFITDPRIKGFELYNYEENKNLTYENAKNCDYFYKITPNSTLYLVVNSASEYYYISFKYSNYNSIIFISNEVYTYPFIYSPQIIETTIENTNNKTFIFNIKQDTSSTCYLSIDDKRYLINPATQTFCSIITGNEFYFKIETSLIKKVVNLTYILAPYSNITNSGLICKEDSSDYQVYFINKPTNFLYFWYSLSNDRIEYYNNKQLMDTSKLKGFQTNPTWDNNYFFMKEKGCFQIQYLNLTTNIDIFNNKESFLISSSELYTFRFKNPSKNDLDITIYSTENNFINKLTISYFLINLEIKRDNNKYFYNFIQKTNNEIVLNINFNLNTAEYIMVDFDIKNYIPLEKVEIQLNEEDNEKIQNIGNQGTLEIITDYNDIERNIFSISDIQYYTFNNTMLDTHYDKKYNVQCRLWKSSNGRIKIFCQFDEELIYSTKELKFSDTSFTYKSYNISIISNTMFLINRINAYIPFIYSDKQIINLESEDILSFRFNYVSYSNENLFLFDNHFKSVNFDNCLNNRNEKEIICQISNETLKNILSIPGEKLYLASTIRNYGKYIFESVEDIIIISSINKKVQYVQITKLLNEIAELHSFIYYETNVTNIPNLTSNCFDIDFEDFSSFCMFKKKPSKKEDLLLLICYANKTGNISFGRIETKELNNISIEYNFIITEGRNDENILVKENGGIIYEVYPETMDFTNDDSLTIKIGIYGNLKGIRLNPNSENELDCSQYSGYLECIVLKSHFKNNKMGYYNIYYENNLNKSSIKYEAPLIYVILDKETEEEVESEEENEIGNDEKEEESKEKSKSKEEEESKEEKSKKEEEKELKEEEEKEGEKELKKEEKEKESKEEESKEESKSKEEEESKEEFDSKSETNNDGVNVTNSNNTDININNNNDNNSTTLIVVCVCVPIGIIILILSSLLLYRWRKRNNGEKNERPKSHLIPMMELMND